MKVTDYIIEFLISKGITDIFGYPGGVICHLIDSASKYQDQIHVHTNYHEQASAFAACGYAQEANKLGVAFSTSGPGATNLITGIANAYFDSIPTLFLTGQVDTYSLKGELSVRQRGFQETDIVSMVKAVTKYAVRVEHAKDIKKELEKAYQIATKQNPGPVLLDLPADIQRADIDLPNCAGYLSREEAAINYAGLANELNTAVKNAKRPCLLIGNGIKQSGMKEDIKQLIDKLSIPAVFSMPAFDTLPYNHKHNFGFIGANGHRYANFVLGKSDLIITLGSRMDLKQVGNNRTEFAAQAKLIRIDIDKDNFAYPVHLEERQILADVSPLLHIWNQIAEKSVSGEWIMTCTKIRSALSGYDDEAYTKLLCSFGDALSDNITITADVGQSEVWLAQQLHVKNGQTVHISAGHGAMGYSLPAAIGSYYASHKPVVSFNGDGGIQMNIQELQFLARITDHLE